MYNKNHITYLSNGNEIKGLWIEIGLSNEIFLTKYSWNKKINGYNYSKSYILKKMKILYSGKN